MALPIASHSADLARHPRPPLPDQREQLSPQRPASTERNGSSPPTRRAEHPVIVTRVSYLSSLSLV